MDETNSTFMTPIGEVQERLQTLNFKNLPKSLNRFLITADVIEFNKNGIEQKYLKAGETPNYLQKVL